MPYFEGCRLRMVSVTGGRDKKHPAVPVRTTGYFGKDSLVLFCRKRDVSRGRFLAGSRGSAPRFISVPFLAITE